MIFINVNVSLLIAFITFELTVNTFDRKRCSKTLLIQSNLTRCLTFAPLHLVRSCSQYSVRFGVSLFDFMH